VQAVQSSVKNYQRRPKTARPPPNAKVTKEEAVVFDLNDPLVRASERHSFDDKDAEIEHLRKELEIITRKALISDDMQN